MHHALIVYSFASQAFPRYGSYSTYSTGGDISPKIVFNLQLNPPQIFETDGSAQQVWYSLFGDRTQPENAYATKVIEQDEQCCQGNGPYIDLQGPLQYTQIANSVVDGVPCTAFKAHGSDGYTLIYYYSISTNLTQAIDQVDSQGQVIIHTKYKEWSTEMPDPSVFDSTQYPCNGRPLRHCGGSLIAANQTK
jgi:hypothetical protein